MCKMAVINFGASLSVWKDAERKTIFGKKGHKRRRKLIGREHDSESHSSSSLDLEQWCYSGLWLHMYVCGYVHICMHTYIHMAKSNN